MKDYSVIEQGPIRPPSEAGSLLLRVSRNCPWNRCLFCPVYKEKKFSRRTVEEVKNDIDELAASIARLRNIVKDKGEDRSTLRDIVQRNPSLMTAASWIYGGEHSVFLQDADSLVLKTGDLVEIIDYLHQKIPGIGRVTTYTRSRTLSRKEIGELKQLRQAGLTRLHVGLESGSDEVLEFVKKGVSSDQQIEGGQKAKEAGFILSHYVMPGLGGKDLWKEHALETAKVINAVNPDYIRLRTLGIHPAAPLAGEYHQGNFVPLNDEEVVVEEKLLIENIEGVTSTLYSDHVLNLLEELQGVFPRDKEYMLGVAGEFLALPPEEQEMFCLGRRTGIYRFLEDRFEPSGRERVKKLLQELKQEGKDVNEFIRELMLRFL